MAARTHAFAVAALATAALAGLAGCGRGADSDTGRPQGAATGDAPSIPVSATKNTARVPGSNAIEVAAGASLAVYPGAGQRPASVSLADASSWPAVVAGASLMAPPLKAPVLLTDGGEVPETTARAIEQLDPSTGKLLRLGAAGAPEGADTVSIGGADPYTLAGNIDAYRARLTGRWSRSVVVAASDEPAYAVPAAAWAAKSGDPVLFTARDRLAPATAAAIREHGRPSIFILGPASAISGRVADDLARLGKVTRISGSSAAATSVAFAKFSKGGFGWGASDPGHGFQFAGPGDPAAAGASAPLAASGIYGPMLVLNRDGSLPAAVREYLKDIRPGYSSDPVRGVYNHGWLVGDAGTVPAETQAEIDELLEIRPVR